MLATCTTGYTTNLPLADVTGGKAWVVWTYDGQPLPRDHGGPVRLLVPHLYFWKSAKWVTRLTLLDHDERASGSATATTTAATRGSSSATRATDGRPAITDASGAPSGGWCTGVVREVRHPNPDAVLLRLEVDRRTDHLPGQHYVVRLTAEDGYTASRSYSVASAPGRPAARVLRRAARRRRGLDLPRRRGRARRRARAARPDRRLVRLGRRRARGRRRRRHRRGAAGGDAAARPRPRPAGPGAASGLRPHPRGAALPRRAGRPDRWCSPARRTTGARPAGWPRPDLAPLLDRTPGAAVYVCGSAGFAEAAGDLLMDLGVPADRRARGAVRPDGLNAREPRPDDRTGPRLTGQSRRAPQRLVERLRRPHHARRRGRRRAGSSRRCPPGEPCTASSSSLIASSLPRSVFASSANAAASSASSVCAASSSAQNSAR